MGRGAGRERSGTPDPRGGGASNERVPGSAGREEEVGNRAFYLRNNQWEEADAAGAREVRKVKMFSDEYFALVKSDEGFRKAQEIGAAMSINVGRERIVVEK